MLGGGHDGPSSLIPVRALDGAEYVVDDEGTVCRLEAEQQRTSGYELAFIAQGTPKRRREQRRAAASRLTGTLKPCYRSFLHLGLRWRRLEPRS